MSAVPSDPRPLVLVVDDNTDHVELLRLALTPRYRVVTASNGLDGYALACQVRPNAILLNLAMPILDGQTVVRKLRVNPETADIPVILVTGIDVDALEPLPGRADLLAILRKPCHQGEILDALTEVLSPPPGPGR